MQSLPHHPVEQFVHCLWRLSGAAIKPPFQKRQQVSGERMRASIQFALNQILQAHVLQTSGDPASEVALRKFEERVDTSGIDQSAVELLRITDMRKILPRARRGRISPAS